MDRGAWRATVHGLAKRWAQTRWLINTKHLFLAVLEVGGLRSWHRHPESLVRFCSQAADGRPASHRVSRAGGLQGCVGSILYNCLYTVSIPGGSTSQHHLLIPSNWALRFQYVDCRRTRTCRPQHRDTEEAA